MPNLSNGTTFNDLEWHLTRIQRHWCLCRVSTGADRQLGLFWCQFQSVEYKNFSYCKKIARQHFCHNKFWQGLGMWSSMWKFVSSSLIAMCELLHVWAHVRAHSLAIVIVLDHVEKRPSPTLITIPSLVGLIKQHRRRCWVRAM